MVVTLCGCSLAYRDEDGTRHVFGFGATNAGTPRDGEMFIAPPRELETLGLSVVYLADGYSIAFGWIRVREGELANRAGSKAQAGAADAPSERIWRFGPFFAMAVRAPLASASAGAVTSVETVGLALVKLGPDTELRLGYGHDAVLGLGENVLVRGNPIREIEASFSDDAQEGGTDED